jgi:hypothetical protein
MPIDDLSAPLGLSRKPGPAYRRIFAYLATASLFGITISGFAVWRAGMADRPATRPPIFAPVSPRGVTSLLPERPESPPRNTAPSADADTTLPADLITVEKAQGYARETNADTLQAGPNERIITIIDGRSGARQHIRVPATSAPVFGRK